MLKGYKVQFGELQRALERDSGDVAVTIRMNLMPRNCMHESDFDSFMLCVFYYKQIITPFRNHY